jgi:CheY-like chemotaxis protein
MRDHVLVIDDDEDLRYFVGLLLESAGFSVLEAPDCASGCALVKSNADRLHAILVDYFMPGMTPTACFAALREQAGADVPVVLITAAADAAQRAVEVGCQRWLSKPFTPAQLTQVLAADGP